MSRMVTVRTPKFGTYLPLNRWTVDSNRQALEQISCFLRISRRIRQAPSDLRQEFPGTDTHGAKCFLGHWEEIVGPAYLFIYLFIFHTSFMCFVCKLVHIVRNAVTSAECLLPFVLLLLLLLLLSTLGTPFPREPKN